MIATTEIGFVRMRVSKVVRLSDEDDFCEFVVLNELDGDRHLVIQIGSAEAFALAAGLGDVEWGRPMTYQEGDSAEAVLMRRALTTPPMTVQKAER